MVPPLLSYRMIWCWISSWPWLFRGRFPVNSFSANYNPETADPRSTSVTRFLYRAKKWQYVSLKHCLQFGLNISVALSIRSNDVLLPLDPEFRIYFLIMSLSFVVVIFKPKHHPFLFFLIPSFFFSPGILSSNPG